MSHAQRRIHLSVEVTQVPAPQRPSPTEDALLNEVTDSASTRRQATRCLHLRRKRFQHLNLREGQRQNRPKASRPGCKYEPCCEHTPCNAQQSEGSRAVDTRMQQDLDVGDVQIIRLMRCARCTRSSSKGKGCNSDGCTEVPPAWSKGLNKRPSCLLRNHHWFELIFKPHLAVETFPGVPENAVLTC